MNERPQPPPTIVEAQQQHAAALKRRERRHATIVVVVGLLLVGAAALAIGRSNTVTMPPGGDGDAAVVPVKEYLLKASAVNWPIKMLRALVPEEMVPPEPPPDPQPVFD